MLKTAAIAICPKHLGKVAGGLLLLAALPFLVGCQGVSAAGSSGQQQSTTLSLLTATADFGSVAVGSSKTLTVTATNSGPASVTVSGAGFQLSGITAPLTLNASQSMTFTIAFAPQASGSSSGTAAITSDASNASLTIALSGTGVAPGALGSNPTSLSFGGVTVGNKQSLSETVTNTGGSSVTISQVGISGTGYSLSGITAPITLTAGQIATFTVAFAPASAGSVSGNVTVTSNSSNPTLTIPLSGTGVAPGALGSNPT